MAPELPSYSFRIFSWFYRHRSWSYENSGHAHPLNKASWIVSQTFILRNDMRFFGMSLFISVWSVFAGLLRRWHVFLNPAALIEKPDLAQSLIALVSKAFNTILTHGSTHGGLSNATATRLELPNTRRSFRLRRAAEIIPRSAWRSDAPTRLTALASLGIIVSGRWHCDVIEASPNLGERRQLNWRSWDAKKSGYQWRCLFSSFNSWAIRWKLVHPRHPRLRKGSGWGPPAPWMWIQWMRFLLGLQKVPVESTVFDGFGWVLDGVFLLRGSRRITKNFKVLLQNCKSLPASSCGTLCFLCVFFRVLFSDLEWIPTSQSRSPKALTRPAIVGIFVPSSWAGNHWVQVWNRNFGRSNWGCHRAQKLRHPCTNWKKLWGLDYQTIPDYTWLPDLFEALKCRNKLNKFHWFLTYLNHMEKTQQCSTPLLFCQRLPRHAWGWEETKTNRLQSCTPLLLVLSHRDVSFISDLWSQKAGLPLLLRGACTKQTKSISKSNGDKPMKDDGSWEVALEVNGLTRRGTFCGCRFWWQ